jgi:hypothetical protein
MGTTNSSLFLESEQMPGQDSPSPSTSPPPEPSPSAKKKKKPAKKKKDVVDSRANSERERRQQIRDSVLDLRDILPGFQAYLGNIPKARQIRLRDMNTVQILDVTVKLLTSILQNSQGVGNTLNRNNPVVQLTQLVPPPALVQAGKGKGKGFLPPPSFKGDAAAGDQPQQKRKKSSSESETDRPYFTEKKLKVVAGLNTNRPLKIDSGSNTKSSSKSSS